MHARGATNIRMWYIVVMVLGSVMILGITTTTMYHLHTIVVSKCMHVVHSGGSKFNDGFEYSLPSIH